MDAAFQWHPSAQAFDGAGKSVSPLANFAKLIPDRPAGAALAQALAGQGRAFRIGGAGDAPDGMGFETLTGGSMGTPRRIRRSQASWTASFTVNAGLFGIGPDLDCAVLGRLVHSLALYGAFEVLHLGGTLHLLDELRPAQQRAALAARGVKLLYATPAQMRLLVQAGGPILPLQTILIGGSKLDARLRAAVLAMSPTCVLHEFYGAAEASFITLAGADAPDASVGRAYPGVQIRVQADDPAAVGEIWVKSPYLFQGYAGTNGSATWHDGWLSLGEHGALRDGFLYLAGRTGRMIKIADQAVYPEEVEAFLLAFPGIVQAAVLPRPDRMRGAQLVACLQGQANDAALLSALRSAFGPLVAPRALHWVADWPVLASGKTDLAALARAMP